MEKEHDGQIFFPFPRYADKIFALNSLGFLCPFLINDVPPYIAFCILYIGFLIPRGLSCGGKQVLFQADVSVLVAVNPLEDAPWPFRHLFSDKKAIAVRVPLFEPGCRFLYPVIRSR